MRTLDSECVRYIRELEFASSRAAGLPCLFVACMLRWANERIARGRDASFRGTEEIRKDPVAENKVRISMVNFVFHVFRLSAKSEIYPRYMNAFARLLDFGKTPLASGSSASDWLPCLQPRNLTYDRPSSAPESPVLGVEGLPKGCCRVLRRHDGTSSPPCGVLGFLRNSEYRITGP